MSDLPLEISVEDLDRIRRDGEDHALLDVREPHELEIICLSGSLVTLAVCAKGSVRGCAAGCRCFQCVLRQRD